MLVLSILLCFSAGNVFAASNTSGNEKKITDDEVKDIQAAFSKENIDKAMKKIDLNKPGKQRVNLSDKYYIEYTMTEERPSTQINSQVTQASDIDTVTATSAQTCSRTSTWDAYSIVGIHIFQWSLTGAFKYDGTSATAIGASANAGAWWSWEVQQSNATYYSNKAVGTYRFAHKLGGGIGIPVETVSKNASIECDKDGNMFSYTD